MLFKQKLNNIINKNNSLLCIGLDTDFKKIPKSLQKRADPLFEFNKTIIEATNDLICSYKPNIAFYEAYGIEGLKSLKKTINYLKSNFKDIPIILDSKRGDIGNTSKMYAKAAFEYWGADAITIYPNLGLDSILPFLEYKDKLMILLIKTSNPDSKMFQDIKVNNEPYYLKMAKIVKAWNYSNIGLFVGATYPEELKSIRRLFPSSIILTAGIGAQKAILKKTVKAGVDKYGRSLICNNSREILYASDDEHFAKASRKRALAIRNEINKYRYEK